MFLNCSWAILLPRIKNLYTASRKSQVVLEPVFPEELKNEFTQKVTQSEDVYQNNNQSPKSLDSKNEALTDACSLALEQHPLFRTQVGLKTDAIFRSARYALLVEDNTEPKRTVTTKNSRPSSVWSRSFLPAQTKGEITPRKFLRHKFLFSSFHTNCGNYQCNKGNDR